MSLRASGQVDTSKLVKDVTLGDSSKSKEYIRSLEFIAESTMSAEEAVSLCVEQRLSVNQYKGLRAASLAKNCNLYPSYKTVLKAKQQCYPLKADMTFTESSGEVKLQSLLHHTSERILLAQSEVVKDLTSDCLSSLSLICKWGCDGSSGHSIFKQKFDDISKSDESIFFTSLVPLQLISTHDKTIVWKNPRPSSSRFCRPIRIQFLHEDVETTVKEMKYVQEQENQVGPFQIIMNGKHITISYHLAFTMIDGKACNAVTNTASTQRCYLCQATSKDFNNIDAMINRKITEVNLQFGISILHAWIRFFECCLHISYRLEIRKWQARSAEEKNNVSTRKKNIQLGFRHQLGLIVDQPKPGFGSSNDGNTARRFFEEASVSSLITGVDQELIERFHILLQVISSGNEINLVNFKAYGLQTARKFVQLYPWFYMPTSVHKLLIHGSEIAESAILPIGQMSEEAQESCNKYIRKFRTDYTRKCSRIKTMQDLFLRLMMTSDPFISSLKKLPTKKIKSLSPEAVKLLIQPSTTESKNYENDLSISDTSSDYESDD
jgi:hypothetical protein